MWRGVRSLGVRRRPGRVAYGQHRSHQIGRSSDLAGRQGPPDAREGSSGPAVPPGRWQSADGGGMHRSRWARISTGSPARRSHAQRGSSRRSVSGDPPTDPVLLLDGRAESGWRHSTKRGPQPERRRLTFGGLSRRFAPLAQLIGGEVAARKWVLAVRMGTWIIRRSRASVSVAAASPRLEMAPAPAKPPRPRRRRRDTARVGPLVLYGILVFLDVRGRVVMGGVMWRGPGRAVWSRTRDCVGPARRR